MSLAQLSSVALTSPEDRVQTQTTSLIEMPLQAAEQSENTPVSHLEQMRMRALNERNYMTWVYFILATSSS